MKTIKMVSSIVILLMAALTLPGVAGAADLKVMMTGLGTGTVTSSPAASIAASIVMKPMARPPWSR